MKLFPALFGNRNQNTTHAEPELKASNFGTTETTKGIVLTHKRARHPGSRVIYPAIDNSDPWQVTYLGKLKRNVDEIWEPQGHFSICPIREATELFNLHFTPETQVVFDRLRTLHCMSLKDIHPDIVKQLPELITFIFTEGQVRPGSVTITQE